MKPTQLLELCSKVEMVVYLYSLFFVSCTVSYFGIKVQKLITVLINASRDVVMFACYKLILSHHYSDIVNKIIWLWCSLRSNLHLYRGFPDKKRTQ